MRDTSLPWEQARRVAAASSGPLAVAEARLTESVGSVLARPIVALTDLPPFASAAMDGYAVRGDGPWRISEESPRLAGQPPAAALDEGHAVPIATGALLPGGNVRLGRQSFDEWLASQ